MLLPIRATVPMNYRIPAALASAPVMSRAEPRHWRWLIRLAYAVLSITIFSGWFVVTRFHTYQETPTP